MRIRIIKNHKKFKKGEIVEVSNNVAFGLLDAGAGVISKDMTGADMKTKGKK